MNTVIQTILGSSFITVILTGFITYFFHTKTEKANAAIKREFEILSQIQTTDFEWKKETLKVLGQVYIHLNRTRQAYENYYSKLTRYNQFYEDEVLYTSNKYIRDLLIESGHQIPPELLEDTSKLVEHYDVWLAKYNSVRKESKNTEIIHIYVGPDGFIFPDQAEVNFKIHYINLFKEIKKYYQIGK